MSFWLVDALPESHSRSAVVYADEKLSYGDLSRAVERWGEIISSHGVQPGEAVAIIGDFLPESFSLLLALAANSNVILPLRPSAFDSSFFDVANVSAVFAFEQ